MILELQLLKIKINIYKQFQMESPKQTLEISKQQQCQDLESQKACRICLNEETSQDKFIDYCQCKGTIKYVHELCLKTYVMSKISDQQANLKDVVKNKQYCDICKAEFQVSWKNSYQLINWKKLLQNETATLLVIIAGFLIMIGSIIVMTSTRDKVEQITNDEIKNIVSVVIIILCCVSILFLLSCQTYIIYKYLIIKSIKINKIAKIEQNNEQNRHVNHQANKQ
ncbi:RING-variant domain protein (macronuclear) [Tetrahymena thermophila SB210]|uniref:RING-variant domain protein n=1 Tax=Tetrahymena thermophila (strain SB210) TaxID=312017 RepID=W7XCU0_TETTS|nr:RING-variant domain protein [Tetrahymena thermophila SB210]EWS74378.1 RING-variant domain protein [Tetrahymena thermophila SB210]|eukprot:XP_012653055.1 RING-variant domain protein [Tetrahymena thermophila SB210]